MSATGDGLSAEARERLGFPPERHVAVEAQLAELRASRVGPGVDGGGDVDGRVKLWCRTCEHTHIAQIPALTYMCADCGFGVWTLDIAVHHAMRYDHVVYPVPHEVELLVLA